MLTFLAGGGGVLPGFSAEVVVGGMGGLEQRGDENCADWDGAR